MRKLLKYTFAIFILTLKLHSQEYTDFITKNWKYFTLKQNTKAIVLEHIPNELYCGTCAFASVTIVKTAKGKIFRVLNLCNLENYDVNEEIIIIPSKKPKFGVGFPSKHLISEENKINQEIYSDTISKTTWASIEKAAQ